MTKSISAMIYWEDLLYGPDLQAWINERMALDPDLIAPMRTVHNRPRFFDRGQVDLLYDQDGATELRQTAKGPRIMPSEAKSIVIDTSQHGYKNSVWISDTPGLAWRIALHPNFAMVLPGTSVARRSRKEMSEHTLFIMQRPQSAHDRLKTMHILDTLWDRAADLLTYTWSSGILLRDPFGEHLNEPILLKSCAEPAASSA